MILNSILLCWHKQTESGLSTWITIIISVLTLIALVIIAYKQIRSAKDIVRIQIQHKVFEEFRDKINASFQLWEKKDDKRLVPYPNNCMGTIKNFETNYDYLFNFPKEYFRELKDILDENTPTSFDEELSSRFAQPEEEERLKAVSLSNFKRAKECWEALFADLGKRIIG